MRKVKIILSLFFVNVWFVSIAQVDAYSDYQKIRYQGFEKSNLREYAVNLTDVIGPRLSGTQSFAKACEWAAQELKNVGVMIARVEPWGEFGNGWQTEKFYIAQTKPYYQHLVAVPRAWTGSTNGHEFAEVVMVNANKVSDLMKYTGNLKGKVVVTPYKNDLEVSFEPSAKRFTEEELVKMGEIKEFKSDEDQFITFRKEADKLNDSSISQGDLILFCQSEGALAVIENSGSFGTIQSVGDRGGRFLDSLGIPVIDMTHEHYARMVRLIDRRIPVEIELDIRNVLVKDQKTGLNVIGEITGTDKVLKDEIVMIGAHIDSWHAATGGNDNGSGVIVMMEVMRILKAAGVQPKRTIRIALWGNEEQGLLGSKAWAEKNLFNPEKNEKMPEFEKISAYYNFDYGTGRIWGIYLNNNLALRPIFDEFFKPLADLGVKYTSMRSPGGSDHLTFNSIGIPGFAFIQDRIDYGRTYHTNMDTFERIHLGDLKQAAVVIATLVYQTANYPEKLPRKEVMQNN